MFLRNLCGSQFWGQIDNLEEGFLRNLILTETHELLHVLVWEELGHGWKFANNGCIKYRRRHKEKEKAFYEFSYAQNSVLGDLTF